MSTVSASQFVQVNPGVIGAGGTGLSMSGLLLTNGTRVPIGTVQSFPTLAAVQAYFGSGSVEAAKAAVYFSAFDTSTIKPGAYLIAQYPWTAPVAAYLRGGVSGLTLAAIQAITTGTIIITVDGTAHTSGAINLSSATSFSNAAALITTALASSDAVVTGTIATTVLTVSAVSSGALAVGQLVTGTGVTAGTTIISLGTGTGGTGTYNLSAASTVGSPTTITAGPVTVTYDSTSSSFVISAGSYGAGSTIGFATGALAATLALTAATGAVTSQGAAIAVPGTFMTALANQTKNWATFTTAFEPVTNDCVAFAAWNNSTNGEFAYLMWDTDNTVASSSASTTCAGYLIAQASYSGTCCIYQPTDEYLADFVSGVVAATDFNRTNGRITSAFKSQSGLIAGVSDDLTYANVIANGYNCYVSTATAAQGFTFFSSGSVSGPFKWLDTYTDQIWLNAGIQLAVLSLLTQVNSAPYSVAGYALIDAACLDPIGAALNAGVIRSGIPLSNAQIAEVNAMAGMNVATTIQNTGYYLQIQPASASVRAARTSPPITLFYTDGGSIQKVVIASLSVQ